MSDKTKTTLLSFSMLFTLLLVIPIILHLGCKVESAQNTQAEAAPVKPTFQIQLLGDTCVGKMSCTDTDFKIYKIVIEDFTPQYIIISYSGDIEKYI